MANLRVVVVALVVFPSVVADWGDVLVMLIFFRSAPVVEALPMFSYSLESGAAWSEELGMQTRLVWRRVRAAALHCDVDYSV